MPFKIVYKDILTLEVDALVNSTNHSMYGYSGIDEILHEMGGPKFEEECARFRDKLYFGKALYTKAYGEIKSKYVIHTYGPHYYNGLEGEPVILKSCYMESLKLADDLNCKTVAFPLICAGSMHYPIEAALGTAIVSISEYLNYTKSKLDVTLAIFGGTAKAVASKVLSGLDELLAIDDEVPSSQESPAVVPQLSIDDAVKNAGKPFKDVLLRMMMARDLNNPDVYGPILMPKQTFNKLINGKVNAPKKETLVAIALVMKLSMAETEELLASAGLSFAPGNRFDCIVKYFIERGEYDVFEINTQLVRYGESPIYAG